MPCDVERNCWTCNRLIPIGEKAYDYEGFGASMCNQCHDAGKLEEKKLEVDAAIDGAAEELKNAVRRSVESGHSMSKEDFEFIIDSTRSKFIETLVSKGMNRDAVMPMVFRIVEDIATPLRPFVYGLLG